MSLKKPVAKALTTGVIAIVLIGFVPSAIQAWLNPTTESFAALIVAAAVNWWVPIVTESPLLFVGLLFLFSWAGVEELMGL